MINSKQTIVLAPSEVTREQYFYATCDCGGKILINVIHLSIIIYLIQSMSIQVTIKTRDKSESE